MKRLNVLFVIPRYVSYGNSGHYVMPMGTLYVSSALKQAGIANVFTLNLNHSKGKEKEILSDCIHNNHIDVFCVGGLSGEYADIARMVRYSRQIKPTLTIVCGGGIITADPKTAMQALPEVDYGVIGEGETTIVELIDALQKNTSAAQINGLIFSSNQQFIISPRRQETGNLDEIPLPDYEGFDYGTYLCENPDMSDEGRSYTQISVIGGRSCKYHCTFCFHPSGEKYRQRSLDSIFTEIDYLLAKYNVTYIALREELFATDNRRVAEFCSRMEKYSFEWSIQLRIDSINSQLVNTLKNTHCRYVFVGVESAHNDILKSMRKGITVQQIETALNMLAEANISSRSGIIFGDKAETLQTAMCTFDWYRAHKSRNRMFVDMIIAFPGSQLYIDACNEGKIPDTVQFLKDGCPIVNVSRLSDTDFLHIVNMVEGENQRKYKVKQYRKRRKKIVLATSGQSFLREQIIKEQSFQIIGLVDFRPETNKDIKIQIINGINFYNYDNDIHFFEQWLRKLQPDLLVVYKMPFLLPESIFNLPKCGSINIHPSLLPKYRGANPWFEIFKNAEKSSGVTIHKIDKYADHGKIMAQTKFDIPNGSGMHNLSDLQAEAEKLAFPLLVSVIANINNEN